MKCFHFLIAQQTAPGLRTLLECQWRRMTHFGLTGVYFVSVHSGEALCLHFFFQFQEWGFTHCALDKLYEGSQAHCVSGSGAALKKKSMTFKDDI